MMDNNNRDELYTLNKYDPAIVAERIKDIAYMQNITIKELLQAVNVGQNTINQMSRRGVTPSADKLARIADYLQVSIDYLMSRTDNPHGSTDGKTREQPSTVAQALEIIANEMQVSTDYVIGRLGVPADFGKDIKEQSKQE